MRVPFPTDSFAVDEVNQAFHALHERAYTFRLDSAIEIVNFHLVARVVTAKPTLTPIATTGSGQPKGRRMVDFDESGRLETTIYERSELIPGVPIAGPLDGVVVAVPGLDLSHLDGGQGLVRLAKSLVPVEERELASPDRRRSRLAGSALS